MRSRLFRVVFGLSVFTALFLVVGKAELARTLYSVRPIYILHLAAISVVMIWVSCIKWRLFLRAGGSDAPMSGLLRLYTIGYFVNLVSPSVLGGDIVRSYQLSSQVGNKRDAFVSTFLERFTGLFAMTTLALVFVLLGAEITRGLEIAVWIMATISFVVAAICFSNRAGDLAVALTRSVAEAVLPERFAGKLNHFVEKLSRAFDFARGNYPLFFRALLLSLLFHLLTILNTYVTALAVGWGEPSIGGLFVVVPLVLIVSMVPITPSGLGLQEGAFLVLLERIGAGRGEALGVGLVLRAKMLILGLVGGLLWISLKRKSAVDASVRGEGSIEVQPS